jgi:hypothetical protein
LYGACSLIFALLAVMFYSGRGLQQFFSPATSP